MDSWEDQALLIISSLAVLYLIMVLVQLKQPEELKIDREFYQNWADIRITASLPPNSITELTPEGNPANTGNSKGSGPLSEDIKIDMHCGDDNKKDGTNGDTRRNRARGNRGRE